MAEALSAKEEVCIVDVDNKVVGKADRAVMRAFNLPHRASYIVVTNSSGKFLVQRRTMGKDYCPGFLDPMAGGVVQFDESFEANAEREAHEELGITGVPLHRVGTFYYADTRTRVWGAIFTCVFDGPLVLQEDEVDEVLEMTADEILRRRDEFTPDGMFAFERYSNLCI